MEKSIEYLLKLRDIYDKPLYKHRRKTFVIGFIVALKSVRNISLDLLQKVDNPYSFVLTYKFSQDHLELLFGCIRGKNGWNNNPDLRQFKSALQRILLRIASIKSSQYNCLLFEKDASPIFHLKWTKKRSPVHGTASDTYLGTDVNGDCRIYDHIFADKLNLISEYKNAILEYIGGFIVRKIMRDIECDICAAALVDGYENKMTTSYASLVSVKNRGGLVFPSSGVVQILKICETAFK